MSISDVRVGDASFHGYIDTVTNEALLIRRKVGSTYALQELVVLAVGLKFSQALNPAAQAKFRDFLPKMVLARSLGMAAIIGIVWVIVFFATTQTVPLPNIGLDAGDEFNATTESDSRNSQSGTRITDWNSSATPPAGKIVHRNKRWVIPAIMAGTSIAQLGFGIYQEISGASRRASQDQVIGEGFQNTFKSLDRNLGMITNVKESIDQMALYNQHYFTSIDQKLDRYSSETISAVNGIGNKIDYRVAEILKSMNDMENMNNERATLTLKGLNTINSENDRRTKTIIDTISDADKNSLQRAQTTWVVIDAADKMNAQRTQETINTINAADRNNFNRTLALIQAIDSVYRRVEGAENATMEEIGALESRNMMRTIMTINATSIADQNNQQRFNLTLDAINKADTNNQNRATATLIAIDTVDQNSERRTNQELTAIYKADMNNYNRTAVVLGAIDNVDQTVNETGRILLDKLNAIDRKSIIRTFANLNATRTADSNNMQRFSQVMKAIQELERNNMGRSAAILRAIIATNGWIDNRTAAMIEAMSIADANNLGRILITLGAINASDRRNQERASAISRGLSIADQNNHQRIMATIGAVSRADRKISLNYAALLQIFEIVTESYQSVEMMRFQMSEEFNRVLDYSRNSKIESTISKLKNFIEYYESEKRRISKLSRDQRVNTLLDERGLLHHLRESRTPRGDSLQSFMFEVMDQGYAIPKDQNDTVAMSALSALFYGCRTQVSVMYYLIQQYIYLADHCYRTEDLDAYNSNIDMVITIFAGFRHSLLGGSPGVPGLIDKVIVIIKRIATSRFILMQGKTYAHLTKLVTLLDRQKSKLFEASLPLISEVPPKLTAQIKFGKTAPPTPLGPWESGVRVSYSVQYRNKDNWYSKIGDWSTPYKVRSKSNPTLRVPTNFQYTRLLFRKFDDNNPEFVGILERGDQIEFIDIDKDLYNAASSSDEEQAIKEASVLISSGANVTSVFHFGRGFLHAAAISNNAELVKAVLSDMSNTIDINAVDENGYTPLHLAAEAGSVDIIELMLQEGADVNARTILGSTALHLASASGYTTAVQALTRSHYLDVNAQDDTGATPLHRAILSGALRNVQTLLSHNLINLNVRSNGGLSALHLSALVKSPEVTETLIQSYETNLNSRSDGDLSALHLAAIFGNIPALKLLSGLDGTDMNPQSVNGWTPLHYAVSLQKEDEVSELLKSAKVIVDVPGKGRITPLHLAASTGKSSIILDLIAHGADLELPSVDGMTAYHLAAINTNIEAMEILANSGANINAKTVNGSTPMHLVAANGHVQSVISILERNHVRLGIRDDRNETAAQLAEKNGHQHIVALINSRTGYEPDVEERGPQNPDRSDAATTERPTQKPTMTETNWFRYEQEKVAYQKAAEQGQLAEVEKILSKGMDIDSRDHNGLTALHKAAGNGHIAMVEFLIKAGATPNARSNDGLTPLAHAIYSDQNDVVSRLLELGVTVGSTSSKLLNSMEPFHVAVLRANTVLMKLLSDNGANLNARLAEGNTALHLAAKQGNVQAVNFLLGLVNVNAKNDEGDTPLQIAEKLGHDEVTELINSKIRSLNHHLVVSSKKGLLAQVKKLAASGGDLKTSSYKDKNATLCHLAAIEGNYDLVKFLVENGCDLNSENEDGEHILHVANYPIARYLTTQGANLNPRTNSGDTPLHYAAARGDVATVGLLVKLLEHNSENIDVRNDDGRTPLSFALSTPATIARKHLLDVVKHLVSGGSNLNTTDKNDETPLIHASYAGLSDVVKYMADQGAYIEAAGKDKETALDKAHKQGHSEIAQYLVQKGAVVRRLHWVQPVKNEIKNTDKEEDLDSSSPDEDDGSYIQF